MFAGFEHVLTQIVESAAAELAVGTVKRFFTCMCAHVTFKVSLDARLEFTLVTCKPFGWREVGAAVSVMRKAHF